MKHVEMRTLVTKQHILEGAGYIYNFYREVYFNREAKRVFSMDFIEDKDEETIEQCVREIRESPDGRWLFYFNSPPAESVRRQLEASLAEIDRTIEDRLREEYFVLLPEIRRVTEQLEAEARY